MQNIYQQLLKTKYIFNKLGTHFPQYIKTVILALLFFQVTHMVHIYIPITVQKNCNNGPLNSRRFLNGIILNASLKFVHNPIEKNVVYNRHLQLDLYFSNRIVYQLSFTRKQRVSSENHKKQILRKHEETKFTSYECTVKYFILAYITISL